VATLNWCACCAAETTGARPRTYCDACGDSTQVEYQVESESFGTFGEAVDYAVSRSLTGVGPVNVDLLCYSRAAAHAAGVLEDYDADPEASVTSRVVIRTEAVGHVA